MEGIDYVLASWFWVIRGFGEWVFRAEILVISGSIAEILISESI